MITEVLLILSLFITAGLLTLESRRRVKAEAEAELERVRRVDIEWKAEKARMRLSEDMRYAKNLEAAKRAMEDFCEAVRPKEIGE
jgi:hypothetical protein